MKKRIVEFINKEVVFWILFITGVALIISAYFLVQSQRCYNIFPLWLKVIIFFGSFVYQYFFLKLYWNKKQDSNYNVLMLIVLVSQFGYYITVSCIDGFIPVWCRIGAVSMIWIGIIIAIVKSIRFVEKVEKQKQLRKQLLTDQYSKYIDIVDRKVNEFSKALIEDEDIRNKIYISEENDYIDNFSEKIEWITDKIGKPDSFIIASCLVYSIIFSPIIRSDEVPKNRLRPHNLKIALNCAFEIISEPITYYKNDSGEWIEEKHPKVQISVPNGIIRDSSLEQRICFSLINNEYTIETIMQLSNIFHLIYLISNSQ